MIMGTTMAMATIMAITTTRITIMPTMAMITTAMTTRTIIMIMRMTTTTRSAATITATITITARMITAAMAIITATTMLMTPRAEPPGGVLQEIQDDVAAGGDPQATLFRLMTWLSPSFPVGAFSYSSGLEWAVEAGDVTSEETLAAWLAAMLTDGPGFCDGVFLAESHRRATAGDPGALADVAELAAAMVPSRERQLETTAQGRAFVEIVLAAWRCAGLAEAMAAIGTAPAYPVAVGVACAVHRLPLPMALHAFLHAVTANWISAAARLVPLGQTASQRTLAALEPVIAATAGRAESATLDDLGSATLRADLASMRHEAQYTRLFRS